jgi:hypothetical protein
MGFLRAGGGGSMKRFSESDMPLPTSLPQPAAPLHDDTAIDRAASAEDAASVFALALSALEKKLSLFVFRGFFEPARADRTR